MPDEDDTQPGDDPLTGVLVGFAHELRSAGLTVGTGDVLTYFAAMTPLDPTDLVDLYWAGRATLLSRHEDQGVYDRVFRTYFLGEDAAARSQLMLSAESVAEAEAALVMPGTEPGPEEDEERPVLGWMASGVDALKHRSFTACTPDELAALRRIMTRMRLTPPRRRTRRTRPVGRAGHRARPARDDQGVDADARGTAGPAVLPERKTKLRPLILILDVSGSMADYSRHLLQFAHTARHAAARAGSPGRGVLLRHQADPHHPGTGAPAGRRGARGGGADRGGLGRRHPDRPVARHLRQEVGRGGLCRGGVVVICSDGLDRGDPEVLAKAMERLDRLCHRIVWLNPHKGDNRDFRPSTLGMMVAAPHIDLLLSGHDLASLEELAGTLPALN